MLKKGKKGKRTEKTKCNIINKWVGAGRKQHIKKIVQDVLRFIFLLTIKVMK